MDLYREARLLPGTLRGRNAVVGWTDLRERGLTKSAATWRDGRGRVLRVHRGIYLVGPHHPDLLDRARAALLAASPGAVLGFQTAAALHGFGVASSENVHLVLGPDEAFPQRPGIVVHRSVVPFAPPRVVRGLPCTPPDRTAVDLARTLDRPDALSTLDAARAACRCTAESLEHELKLHSGLRGIRHARELVGLADPRPECRQESHLRLLLHDAGLDFQPQVPVIGGTGIVTYVLDLADPRRRVGIEYDGASHLDQGRLRDDRARHNWLATRGWRMRYFTDRDLYHDPATLIRTVRAAMR
jgi:very-short-patch-repair endonuclease